MLLSIADYYDFSPYAMMAIIFAAIFFFATFFFFFRFRFHFRCRHQRCHCCMLTISLISFFATRIDIFALCLFADARTRPVNAYTLRYLMLAPLLLTPPHARYALRQHGHAT